MSDLNEDLSQSAAAYLTDSVGVPDAVDTGDELPESMANAVAEFDQYEAEKDIPVSNDVDDTREAAEQREVEQEQTQQRGKKVPLAALHEERTKRQALELQLAAYQQQMQQFQAAQQEAQRAQLQAQQEAEIPPFSEDPEGHVEAVKRQFKQELEDLKNGGQQPQVQQLEQQLVQKAAVLAPVITDLETRFEAANPDYRQAADHAMAVVEQNMRAQHPGINDQQLGMLRTAALVTLAEQCQAQGVNPAEYLYQRAQQLGFKAASRAPRREPPTSLSSLAGSARVPGEGGKVGLSDISTMTDAEFDEYWKGMSRGGSSGPAF